MGSNIYLAREAPRYHTGFGVSLAMCVLAIIATVILRWGYSTENKRRDQLERDVSNAEIRARYSEEEMLELGDRSPFFRYTL